MQGKSKKILITLGVVMALFLVSAWIYLLFFGTPDEMNDVFIDLGFFNSTEQTQTGVETEPNNEPEPTQLEVDGTLNQLTLRPVAGFGYIISSSSRELMYAELGTGHVYKINLDSGEEERISNNTDQQVVRATFNDEGTYVVREVETTNSITASVLDLTENISSISLPPGSDNYIFTANNKLFYTVANSQGLTGYQHDLETDTSQQEWQIPLVDVIVSWLPSGVFVHNKMAPSLVGNIYKIMDGELHAVHQPQMSLLAELSPQGSLALESYYDSAAGTFLSRALITDQVTGTYIEHEIPHIVIPEKCAVKSNTVNYAWCAIETDSIKPSDRNYARNWYMGTETHSDSLWLLDIRNERSVSVLNLFSEAGRDVDVTDLTASPNGSELLFINKLDSSLWNYVTPPISQLLN